GCSPSTDEANVTSVDGHSWHADFDSLPPHGPCDMVSVREIVEEQVVEEEAMVLATLRELRDSCREHKIHQNRFEKVCVERCHSQEALQGHMRQLQLHRQVVGLVESITDNEAYLGHAQHAIEYLSPEVQKLKDMIKESDRNLEELAKSVADMEAQIAAQKDRLTCHMRRLERSTKARREWLESYNKQCQGTATLRHARNNKIGNRLS
ncbi:hypothetical protein LTR47_011771, partial [Exophiala xenobiotica]